MARIAGINIPQNKVVSIALTYIHGIGPYSSKKICEKLEIPACWKGQCWKKSCSRRAAVLLFYIKKPAVHQKSNEISHALLKTPNMGIWASMDMSK